MTQSAVPGYRPPSSGQWMGIGSSSRSMSSPNKVFSNTGASSGATSRGGIRCISLVLTFLISSSVGVSASSPSVSAIRFRLGPARFQSNRAFIPPSSKPSVFSNITVGDGFCLAKRYPIALISWSRLTGSETRTSSPILSTSCNHWRRS